MYCLHIASDNLDNLGQCFMLEVHLTLIRLLKLTSLNEAESLTTYRARW